VTPLYISGCFGWLHEPPPERRVCRGVVLCAPLGNEACNTHRAFVVLADMLAREGMPTLRFDYPGIGDSILDGDATVGPGDWTHSIAAAAEWLKREAKVQEVALCGVRAGATLATLAAARVGNLAALALLAPIATGRALVREMTIRAHAWDAMWMIEAPSEEDGWFEAYGLRIDLAAKQALESIDLRRLEACGAARALIMNPAETPPGRAFADRLASLGTAVERRPFPGFEALMEDALQNEIPREVFAYLAAWLGAGAVPATAQSEARPPPPARLDLGAIAEMPVRFGLGETLAGMFCAPVGRPVRHSVLMVNTGGHPHVGHARIMVTFARRLARQGIASLRMDAAGTGDAALSTGQSTDAYSRGVQDDARAGLRWLEAQCGSGVVVIGLCSGAHVALHVAADPAVRGLVLVNLQKFIWQEGIPLRVVQRNTKRPTQFYVRNLGNAAVWRRVLRGEVNVSGIFRALAGRALRRVRSRADPLLASCRGTPSDYGRVRAWFRDLERRGVPVLYVLSFNDPGLDELEEHFGASGTRLRRFGNVRLHLLHNADHTLMHLRARDELFVLIQALLEDVASVPDQTEESTRAREAA
jgi:alpha/beta superfamily hydrolase